LGKGRFGPNPGREEVTGQGRSRGVMGGYGRLREVTEEENGGKWRNGRKKVEKKRKKLRSSTESSIRCGSEQDSFARG